MTPEVHKFRSAMMGGFNRQDVMEYIEKAAQEQRTKLEAMTKELEQARQEKAALTAELEGLRAQSGSWADQEEQSRASLEESTHAVELLREDLRLLREQLAGADEELAGLRERVRQLEPVARQYEALKDHIATVELDAHRKAQSTVEETRAWANGVRRDAAQWVAALSGSYELLREEVHLCARRAGEADSAFAAQEPYYQELLRRVGLLKREEEGKKDE